MGFGVSHGGRVFKGLIVVLGRVMIRVWERSGFRQNCGSRTGGVLRWGFLLLGGNVQRFLGYLMGVKEG
jgi:hypothetical protein